MPTLWHRYVQQVAMHRVDDGSMKFLVSRQRNVREVLALCVSPNKRVIAVCEKGRTPEEDPGSAQVWTSIFCPYALVCNAVK